MREISELDKMGALAASCRRQTLLYANLRQLAQTILGKLALSRGDVGGVMSLFTDKQKILDDVMSEKNSVAELVQWWQGEKLLLSHKQTAADLNAAVAQLEKAITTFLDSEDQLERYLSHLTGKGQ